ncbi:unnamed protein product [Phytophthora lilii]|uniref:Unnamed protein product n=1 Tax=Phytophthora lilii TaxID=2077276 RepID=A0A9W6U6S5_9STRA|nr:unnamed protein product [Phytophthora lilii]
MRSTSSTNYPLPGMKSSFSPGRARSSSKARRVSWSGNTEEFAEEPGTAYQFNAPVKKALKEQSQLEWTVIEIGWLMDYVVPRDNRYHADIGPLYALDLHTNTMTIPGTGNEVFSTTSARDVAKAVAVMLNSPSSGVTTRTCRARRQRGHN